MKRSFKILFVILLFNATASKAQLRLDSPSLSVNFPDFELPLYSFKKSDLLLPHFKFHSQDLPKQNQKLMAFPKAYTYRDLAFFCKIEVQLEKSVKFPIKFRLGDVNYVDQLEGKE